MSRPTIGEFFKMNHGKTQLPDSLKKIFSRYNMPACSTKEKYINEHNPNFAVERERSGLSKLHEKMQGVDDSCILGDIRSAFTSVSSIRHGADLTAARINQMIIPASMVDDIGLLFFDSMVANPKMIKPYLNVLFKLSRKDGIENSIRLKCCLRALEILKNPVILKDTMLSSGLDRTNAHRSSVCKLVAHLYSMDYSEFKSTLVKAPAKKFSDYNGLKTTLIYPIIDKIIKGEEQEIANLADVLLIIKESKKPQYKNILQDINTALKEIYENKKFKLMKRMRLKELLL